MALSEPEYREKALRILAALATETALVPAIWNLDLASILLERERAGQVTKKEVEEVLSRWTQLPLKTDTVGLASTFTETLALARKQSISVYDASYVELAKREGVGCFDGRTQADRHGEQRLAVRRVRSPHPSGVAGTHKATPTGDPTASSRHLRG